jgi:hypothetical protein
MLNEDAKEKSKILDRLFKAESRNCELEQTVKTLNRRIEILEELTKTDLFSPCGSLFRGCRSCS